MDDASFVSCADGSWRLVTKEDRFPDKKFWFAYDTLSLPSLPKPFDAASSFLLTLWFPADYFVQVQQSMTAASLRDEPFDGFKATNLRKLPAPLQILVLPTVPIIVSVPKPFSITQWLCLVKFFASSTKPDKSDKWIKAVKPSAMEKATEWTEPNAEKNEPTAHGSKTEKTRTCKGNRKRPKTSPRRSKRKSKGRTQRTTE